MEFKAQIEKLEGAVNWTKWRRQIELLLRHHEVLDIVSGVREKPIKPEEISTDDYEKASRAFEKADALAQLILVGSMNDANNELTATCCSAKSVWDKLLSIYEQSSGQRVDRLMEQFFATENDPTIDIATHIARLQRNFYELNDELKRLVKTELPNLLLMSRIMSTLPPQYFEFKSVWESVPVEERTVNGLTERLRLIEMRLPEKQIDSTAFVAKSNIKKRNQMNSSKKPQFERRCFKCHQVGHLARDCFKKRSHVSDKGTSKETRPDGDAFIVIEGVSDSELWIADSGASQHMTSHKEYFVTYEEFVTPVPVQVVGNSEIISAYGQGTVNVEMHVGSKWESNHLTNVWYLPEIGRNLFSVGQTISKDFYFTADHNGCSFIKDGVKRMMGKRTSRGLYALQMRVRIPQRAADVYVASEAETMQIWHERMCHQNKRHVQKVLKLHGVEVNSCSEFCEGCVFGKQHRASFGTRENRPCNAGDQIHADLCGPMQEESVGGSKYFLCFRDDFSKFRRVFFLRSKAEVSNCLKVFLNETNVAGHQVKEFVCDGGTEFNNTNVIQILQSRGIGFRVVMPYTPEQNGVAERENRTLVELARSMVHSKNLPIKLWAEAVNTAVHILNRTGHTTVSDKSPIELWIPNKTVKIDHFRIFGTVCFVHVPKQRRRKWDKKGMEGFFVGYCDEKDGYRVWIPTSNKVMRSRDVIFKREDVVESSVQLTVESVESTLKNEELNETSEKSCGDEENISCRKSQREVRRPQYLNDYVMLAECEIPDSYASAIVSKEAHEWLHAMDDEMSSLKENNTWQLVELPPGKKAIANRWVLRVKTNADGEINRYKARLVVKGNYQKSGIDYDETFSPVARYDTVRTVLSVAASENLHLVQFDVKTAFLYGKLQEEVYMNQPEGYDDESGRVCRLNRSLYGLKQSPRCWNKRFVDFITQKQGMKCSAADPCLFFRIQNCKKLIIAIYVDDGLIAGSDEFEIEEFLEELKKEFKITVGSPMGEKGCFLGMQIVRLKDGSIFVNQSIYAKKLLIKFSMDNSNSVSTPCEKSDICSGNVDAEVQEVPYRQAVGSLMHLTSVTRPDLAYAISIVSENLEHPKVSDWNAVKRIFRYLKGTLDFGLMYQAKNEPKELVAFSDADFAGDAKTRRSRTGVLCKYSGAAITWLSQKQRSVVLSTTEAEYIAASEAAKDVIWLKRLLQEITDLRDTPVLFVDNVSAVKLAKNPDFHKRSKHVEVRYHFVREKFQEGVFGIQHIEGENQVADLMTKPLTRVRFQKLRDMLGLISC